MTDPNAACVTCRFCDAGQCRRNPPQMVLWPISENHPIAYEPDTAWPRVQASDWCGEHKPVTWGAIRGQKP